MNGEGKDTFAFGTTSQLFSKYQVRRLGISIRPHQSIVLSLFELEVVETHAAKLMRNTGDDHDSRSERLGASLQNEGEYRFDKKEMGKVVAGELGFVSVFGDGVFWENDGGIGDHDLKANMCY